MNSDSVVHWFAENKDAYHPKLSSLPTGLVGEDVDDMEDFKGITYVPLSERPLHVLSADRLRNGKWWICRFILQHRNSFSFDLSNSLYVRVFLIQCTYAFLLQWTYMRWYVQVPSGRTGGRRKRCAPTFPSAFGPCLMSLERIWTVPPICPLSGPFPLWRVCMGGDSIPPLKRGNQSWRGAFLSCREIRYSIFHWMVIIDYLSGWKWFQLGEQEGRGWGSEFWSNSIQICSIFIEFDDRWSPSIVCW